MTNFHVIPSPREGEGELMLDDGFYYYKVRENRGLYSSTTAAIDVYMETRSKKLVESLSLLLLPPLPTGVCLLPLDEGDYLFLV